MNDSTIAVETMRAIRFHSYGEPMDVLRLEEVAIPVPAAGRIRVLVHACGLNPADWGVCRGGFAGEPPRGIGLEVSGRVDAVGADVKDVHVRDEVLGMADYLHTASAGAADRAIMDHWSPIPTGLDFVDAAALPMAVETAVRSLDSLGVIAGMMTGKTLLVHGAGTTVGFAAVQIGLLRGCRVIATAGKTFSDRLRALGAEVTSYGDGMVERVLAISGTPPDLILDTAPVSGVLTELIKIAGGDARRVFTVTDFEAAAKLGARHSFEDNATMDTIKWRYDAIPEFAELAAKGQFSVPVARTFGLDEWREAVEISLTGRARGKLVLLLDDETSTTTK